MPGGPSTSTTRPPSTVAASCASSRASSSSRPSSGRRWVSANCCPLGSPTTAASIGSDFPFTRNGSTGVASNRDRVRSSSSAAARTSPPSPRYARRAARFTVSPMTVYVSRYGGPTTPAKSGPALTPMRTSSGDGRAAIALVARRIRSASSSWPTGAPATTMSLPPFGATSDPSSVMSWSSQASDVQVTRSSSAAAQASGPSVARRSSVPPKARNATTAWRCSAPRPPASR